MDVKAAVRARKGRFLTLQGCRLDLEACLWGQSLSDGCNSAFKQMVSIWGWKETLLARSSQDSWRTSLFISTKIASTLVSAGGPLPLVLMGILCHTFWLPFGNRESFMFPLWPPGWRRRLFNGPLLYDKCASKHGVLLSTLLSIWIWYPLRYCLAPVQGQAFYLRLKN